MVAPTTCISVLLPAPFGPSTTQRSPTSTDHVMLLRRILPGRTTLTRVSSKAADMHPPHLPGTVSCSRPVHPIAGVRPGSDNLGDDDRACTHPPSHRPDRPRHAHRSRPERCLDAPVRGAVGVRD